MSGAGRWQRMGKSRLGRTRGKAGKRDRIDTDAINKGGKRCGRREVTDNKYM